MNVSVMIDEKLCSRCGLCAQVCPNKIPTRESSQRTTIRPDRAPLCFRCGQCMAACPTTAIRVEGLSYERDFFALPEGRSGAEPFYELVRSRRAVRNFADREVPHELLERVVEAIASAPPGFPPSKLDLLVVGDREKMRAALPPMIDFYASLLGALRNPFARLAIRRSVGKRRLKTMDEHLAPLLRARMPGLRDGSEDTLLRGAPAMILLLADREGEDAAADAYIAATYAMLAAHALGLGGSIMDVIPPAIERSAELRRLFGLEPQQQVLASVILGFPKYRYLRGIRRAPKSVTWL